MIERLPEVLSCRDSRLHRAARLRGSLDLLFNYRHRSDGQPPFGTCDIDTHVHWRSHRLIDSNVSIRGLVRSYAKLNEQSTRPCFSCSYRQGILRQKTRL